jgi:hypothetical protein
MNAMNTMTRNEVGPALQEVETSKLQALVGGRVEVYEPVSYPPGGYPEPSPWRAATIPFPDPWLVAGQQYVIGTR